MYPNKENMKAFNFILRTKATLVKNNENTIIWDHLETQPKTAHCQEIYENVHCGLTRGQWGVSAFSSFLQET